MTTSQCGPAVAGGTASAGEFASEKLSVHQLIVGGAKRYLETYRVGVATRDVQSILAQRPRVAVAA
ncbi:MAG: hypothetical protein F9B45_11685 [Phycisphaera sp. RhM]|nr:hypothetical protein [Phycisphaera sp. RhM]